MANTDTPAATPTVCVEPSPQATVTVWLSVGSAAGNDPVRVTVSPSSMADRLRDRPRAVATAATLLPNSDVSPAHVAVATTRPPAANPAGRGTAMVNGAAASDPTGTPATGLGPYPIVPT